MAAAFRVSFRDPRDGKVYTVLVEHVGDSSLGLSFVALSGFQFAKKTIVNPADEALEERLSDVRTLHLSLYSILAIEEIGGSQPLAFAHDKSNLLVLHPGHADGKEPT